MAKGKHVQLTMEQKLEALRQRVSEVDVGGGDNRFWTIPNGRSCLRLLPPVGTMEFPFTLVGRHFSLPGKKSAICPLFTSEGAENCPICEVVETLKTGIAAEKTLADNIKLQKRYWMNIVVRSNNPQDLVEIAEGPVILQAGPMIFQQIVALFEHPEYGMIHDVEKGVGIDIMLDRSGQGMDTKYTVTTRRKETPLHDDEEVVAQLLSNALNLDWEYLSGDEKEDAELGNKYAVLVPTYDQLVAKYGICPGADLAQIDWEASDSGGQPAAVESPAPRRQAAAPARQPKEPEVPPDDVGEEITRRKRSRRPVAAEGEEE
jgi:hypothetical protein